MGALGVTRDGKIEADVIGGEEEEAGGGVVILRGRPERGAAGGMSCQGSGFPTGLAVAVAAGKVGDAPVNIASLMGGDPCRRVHSSAARAVSTRWALSRAATTSARGGNCPHA